MTCGSTRRSGMKFLEDGSPAELSCLTITSGSRCADLVRLASCTQTTSKNPRRSPGRTNQPRASGMFLDTKQVDGQGLALVPSIPQQKPPPERAMMTFTSQPFVSNLLSSPVKATIAE